MLGPAFLAFGLTVVVTPGVVVGLRRWRVMDVPGPRSSHCHPTPRGGGIGLAPAVLVAVAVAAPLAESDRLGLFIAGLAFGLIGLVEDLVGIPALKRLPLLFVAAAATVPWLLSGFRGSMPLRVLSAVTALVWLVSYTNACNFMDGINGLAVGHAVVVGVAWCAIGNSNGASDMATLGAIVAAAAFGFAPYNLPRARVFLGDVGAYFIGVVLAYGAVVGIRAGLPPEAVLAPLAVFLADTGVTLVRRFVRGDCWYQAHREHVYQQLTALTQSHTRTTLMIVTVMALCALLGTLSLVRSLPLRVLGDVSIIAIITAYVVAPRRLASRRTPGTYTPLIDVSG